jgi:aryl-alcohol dehydrogenase-like predicted oxidoreductase
MNDQPTRPLGKTGVQVTTLGVGCAWLGRRRDGSIDEDTGLAAILAALDSGVRLIDTASMYVDGVAASGKSWSRWSATSAWPCRRHE